MDPIKNNMDPMSSNIDPVKKEKEPEKKPAISPEQVIETLSKANPEEGSERKFAPGEGIVWSPGDEEDKTLTRWLSSEDVRYEDEK
ncbi:hypothetical protein [Estrella lausannensis]|uniref:Uncharacterized protein n=1 Tax=Estrella lausannensis TaxID=483423 RepID=A0A0H5DNC7_9BACT|nr:hypothetical protein [Estrella lausannensis]CRX37667.1 Hypothetical protein ELAC_0306 [Estrella lausannensis]